MESRIIELETKLAYQEDTVQQLNEAVGRQQQQIHRLESTLSQLLERFRDIRDKMSDIHAGEERPPHY